MENRDYKPPQTAIHTERKMRISCIGAGLSGLCFPYKLQRSFTNFPLTIYEKNAEVPGTWFENTYPGCRCDFPSVNYTYTFEPKGDFSSVYATAAETREYFEDFRTKHGLGKYCLLRHKVVGAQWADEVARWEVQVEDLATGNAIRDSCDILINARGYLNVWRWPHIPGLACFKGPLLHSANWDGQVDLADKCVGLIGNGSSAVHILPAVQLIAKKVTAVLRTPTWISPPFGPDQDMYSKDQNQDSAVELNNLLKLRKSIENGINGLFPFVFADSPLQAAMRAAVTMQMKQRLNLPHLDDKLVSNPAYLELLRADACSSYLLKARTVTMPPISSEFGVDLEVTYVFLGLTFFMHM